MMQGKECITALAVALLGNDKCRQMLAQLSNTICCCFLGDGAVSGKHPRVGHQHLHSVAPEVARLERGTPLSADRLSLSKKIGDILVSGGVRELPPRGMTL